MKNINSKVRKFWKVRITPAFLEFERLAARYDMTNAQFLRALPELFMEYVSGNQQRLWMARSLRYLECIHKQTAVGQKTLDPELQKLLETAISDVRNALQGPKRKGKK